MSSDYTPTLEVDRILAYEKEILRKVLLFLRKKKPIKDPKLALEKNFRNEFSFTEDLCIKCNEWKRKNDFITDSNTKRGYRRVCGICYSKIKSVRYHIKYEQNRIAAREKYRRQHPGLKIRGPYAITNTGRQIQSD